MRINTEDKMDDEELQKYKLRDILSELLLDIEMLDDGREHSARCPCSTCTRYSRLREKINTL